MSVSSVNSPASVAAYTTTAGTSRTVKQTLGSEDFMKLLAVQFQQQDPMKPMEDTAFISQMAQFSSLQNSTDLTKQMGLLRSDQQTLTATGMIGRTVTITDAKGKTTTGAVSAVESSAADGVSLVIDGSKYSLSLVTRVESTPTTTPADLPPAA